MRLYYLLNNKKCNTKVSNADVEIEFISKEHRNIVKLTALKDISLVKAVESFPHRVNFSDYYFLNGYQSWTDTKEYKLIHRHRNIKKSPHIISHMFAMDKYGDNNFYTYLTSRSHGYDIFYSKGKYESFVYNMNYETAYLIFELIKDTRSFRMISELNGLSLKAGQSINIFHYCYYDSYEEGLKAFQEEFKVPHREKIFGYTSWYNYYQKISEEIILRDLEALDDRFNLFQIDDGYETYVGDWLDVDPVKFPNGLKPIVNKIHEKGFKAGIWLAPFAVEEKSKTFKEHPEYLKKDKHGKLVKAGGNWSGFYAIDLENKEAINYVKKCLTHYMEMGFDFFKLDFLYASSLPSYEGKTRCMVQRESYHLLRDILKDKLILGCGANIINSYGAFDYLRIGMDVSLSFDDVLYMRLFHRERPSTKNTLQNTIFRSIFDGHLFYNDPDVFLLREENIGLSLNQRIALSKINALFGSVLMTSDNIATYSPKTKEILNSVLDLFNNGKVLNYQTKGKLISINYELHGVNHELVYNTRKGVFINER